MLRLGIRKVVDMLNRERIRDLSKDIQGACALTALDAAGASDEELLREAARASNDHAGKRQLGEDNFD